MDGVKGENDSAFVGFAQDSGVQKQLHIRVHRFYIPPDPAGRLPNGDGGAPVMTFSKSQRLPERTLKRSSGDAKLMKDPCSFPFMASRNRLLIFSREATPNVTVRISIPPFFKSNVSNPTIRILPEIPEQ